MHLIGGGISKLVYELITVDLNTATKKKSKFFHVNNDLSRNVNDYPFFIPKQDLLTVGECLTDSRKRIPVSFQGGWENIFKKNEGTRMVDYIDFLLYAVPTIIVPKIKKEETRIALLSLSKGCNLALQWTIDDAMIKRMEK